MEGDVEDGIKRNDVLSQSYAECVERVAQQKNDTGFSFVLPQEVLEERRKGWSDLFDKYANEVSNEIELDMNTMKPMEAEDDDEEEEEDEEEEDEDEEKEYYSKCRAPLRKLPALIQYWVDTGNPPYQLVGNDDHTETGSSLSEGEPSKSGRSAGVRRSSGKQKSNTSRCSSVDTAAYILSNTNVTKKAETQAIVEGAKSSAEPPVSKSSPLKETSQKSTEPTNSTVAPSANNNEKSSNEIVQAATPRSSKKFPAIEKSATTPNRPETTNLILSTPKAQEISAPSPQSVKLSAILPELQEFDEMLMRSNVRSTPRTRSSLANFQRKLTPQHSQNSSGFSDSRKKLQNRRKLYTGRDSPVDLVFAAPNDDFVQTSCLNLHPALENAAPQDRKTTQLAARVRMRRKRKRASQLSQNSSQNGNTTQESDQPNGEDNSRGDLRYTDFFESLGLTPSKLIIGDSRAKRAAKRSRKMEKPETPRAVNGAAATDNSLESSIKESENTEDSAVLPTGKARNVAEEPAGRILDEKILRVSVEKLSDEFLSRFGPNVEPVASENEEFVENEAPKSPASSSDSADKKAKRSSAEKIELLTTLTHDSDNSTIIICSCNDNDERSVSEDFFIARSVPPTQNRSLRRNLRKMVAKPSTRKGKSKITQNLDHSLSRAFVRLERLANENLMRSSRTKRKSKETDARADSKAAKAPSPVSLRSRGANTSVRDVKNKTKSPVRDDRVRPISRANLPIGRRIFEETKSPENSEKLTNFVRTRSRCTLGISIPSDEDEDDFTKLLSRIASKSDSTEKIGGTDNAQQLTNGDATALTEKSRKFWPISASSDEEDFYAREGARRTRNFILRNEKHRKIVKKIEEDAEEGKNGVEIAKVDKQPDESNRRVLRSEKPGKEEEAVATDAGKTRTSRERRKTTKNANSTFEDKAAAKVDDSAKRGSSEVRRSKRSKSATSRMLGNQLPVKILPAKSKSANTSRETDAKDPAVASALKNRKFDPKDENFDVKSGLEIVGKSIKLKERTTARARRNDKKNDGNLLRFKTRLDSDSDTDFDGLRFSLNENYKRENSRKATETAKTGRTTISSENKSEIEPTRTTPCQTFKVLSERGLEHSERKLRKRGKNIFEQDEKCGEKIVGSFDNAFAPVETFESNGFPVLVESAMNGTKATGGNQKKTRSRKNSTKSDRSSAASRRNEEPRGSPVSKKKKLRRPRILGNRTEWESEDDDDTDSNKNKVSSSRLTRSNQRDSAKKDDSSKRSSEKDASGDRESSNKQESTRSLFSSIANDTSEDVDLFFGAVAKSPIVKNSVVIEKLNFAAAKSYKSLSRVGSSTMNFRTRLRSESEDDGNS